MHVAAHIAYKQGQIPRVPDCEASDYFLSKLYQFICTSAQGLWIMQTPPEEHKPTVRKDEGKVLHTVKEGGQGFMGRNRTFMIMFNSV